MTVGMGTASDLGMRLEVLPMSGIKEAENELEKVEEALAMADRVIQISRLEQERLSADLPAPAAEQGAMSGPPLEPT